MMCFMAKMEWEESVTRRLSGTRCKWAVRYIGVRSRLMRPLPVPSREPGTRDAMTDARRARLLTHAREVDVTLRVAARLDARWTARARVGDARARRIAGAPRGHRRARVARRA